MRGLREFDQPLIKDFTGPLTVNLGSGASKAVGEGKDATFARAAESAPFERDPPLALYCPTNQCLNTLEVIMGLT